MSTPVETLCKGQPKEFVTYFNYCKNLRFEDKPDYSHLRKLFREVLKSHNLEHDYMYINIY